MSEPSYVYFLIRSGEYSPLLQSAPDGEDAIEAIYAKHAQKRLHRLGIEVLACEMPGWRSDDILNSVTEHLGQAQPPAPTEPPAAPVEFTPEIVERGAQALCGQYERSGGIPWAELPEDRRDVYRYDFQAALEAALAREATDAS